MLNWLTEWYFEPTVVAATALTTLWYWRGLRSRLRPIGKRRNPLQRYGPAFAFYSGLTIVFIALESPVDTLAPSSFAVHMVQHLLLIMVAAPLLLLGNPTMTLLCAVPLMPRRLGLGLLIHQPWFHRLSRVLSWINSPAPAFVIFLGDLYLWHWDRLYNFTLQNQAVHDLEHLCFLGTALLFWSQIIDSRPLRSRLNAFQRAGYMAIASVLGVPLACYFVFSHSLVYADYAHVVHRPFGLTALADQQLAGGIMGLPVLFDFALAFSVYVFGRHRKGRSVGGIEHQHRPPVGA
jgi:putative membrane protein